MIGFLWRWVKRASLAILLLVVLLLLPIGYVELACRSDQDPEPYASLLPPEHHRAESNTYLTYPEWHIVHAYDDYAKVIEVSDPHNYGFLRGIFGFWTSLCDLSKVAGAHGGIPFETKQMVYVIGVSFTAELLGKAAYEETVGRVATYVRGAERTKLDDLSARQARDYAQFLQQVPWYRWDFTRDAAELQRDATSAFRDQERKIALGLEYRAKAAYASVIAQAVANVGHDELTLRMIVDDLAGFSHPDVTFIGRSEAGVEIETVRYRALTRILIDMALSGTNFVEIAGNDDIMLTVLTDTPNLENARSSMSRQGYGDYRHIVGEKVSDLAATLRSYAANGITVEHIHDY